MAKGKKKPREVRVPKGQVFPPRLVIPKDVWINGRSNFDDADQDRVPGELYHKPEGGGDDDDGTSR